MRDTYPAFTAIELILTISFIAILAAGSVPLFRSFHIRNELALAEQSTEQALKRAQLLSQSGMENGVWGVHAPSGTIFLGNSYSERNAVFDESYYSPSGLVEVAGEILEVTFSPVYGEPGVTGVIILEAVNGNTKEVKIPQALSGPSVIDFGENVSMKIDFEHIKNQGGGSAEAASYVGPESLRFPDGDWIPIKTGSTIHNDTNLVIGVTGLAIDRNEGSVLIIAYGGLESGGKEVVDARITFTGARVTNVENVPGDHVTENPFDGNVSNGVGGDEVTWTAGSRSVLFQTRVTNYGDSIMVYWEADEPRF